MIYKESGIEWIGQVPNHWHTLSVSKAYDVTLGKMLQPNSNDENDIKVPYLKAMNVQDGYVSFEKIEEMYCSINELNNYKLECGDLVVCEGGEVARSAVIKENLAGFIFQNSVHRVKGTAKGDTRFLHYLLIALRASGFINILVNKATIAHFTKDKFNSLKIALPPLDEQLIVSDYLDDKYDEIENLIKTKQKLITLLEQQRQSIITETVTKGLNPNVKMKDSGVEWIGEIPEHWHKGKVKHFYNIVLGKMLQPARKEPSDELIKYFKAANVQDRYLSNNKDDFMYASYHDIKNFNLLKGDLLVCEGGEVGRSVILQNDYPNTIYQNSLHRVRGKEGNDNRFLMFLLNVVRNTNFINLLVSKATIAHFTKEKFESLQICLPPLGEQQFISDYLERKSNEIDEIKKLLMKQIDKLKEYRQSLIYEAVTGKIDVRDMELD